MAYYFYLGNVLLPIPPSKLELKISNNNKTYNLINYSQINVLKNPGLSSLEFEVILPNTKYPFAMYKNNFQNAKYYLGVLENLKVNRSAFQFIVVRKFPNGKDIFNTNIKVALEEYTITDTTEEGFDTKVKIKLKQYKIRIIQRRLSQNVFTPDAYDFWRRNRLAEQYDFASASVCFICFSVSHMEVSAVRTCL